MNQIDAQGPLSSTRGFRGATLTREGGLGTWQQRCFRAYWEFSANTVVRFVATKPFILTSQKLWTGQGAARMVVSTGGTEGGTFVPLTTKFCTNTKDGPAAGTTTLSSGGTVTLGTEREVLRADSGSAGGGTGSADLQGGERVLAAGTYYMSVTVTGTTAGMYTLEWEELDS